MKVLLWHVHGSYVTALVQGGHEYLLPVLPHRGPEGRGRARTWQWPATAREVTPEAIAAERPDVVVLQRPHEEALLREWAGLRAGRDVPALYLEHNTPKGDVPCTRHPVAGRDDLVLVHVTHFNALFWDAGHTRTVVVEHGIPEPAARWSPQVGRAAVVVNEPVRRGRVTGTDLLPGLAKAVPLDVFGMGVQALQDRPWPPGALATYEDLPQDRMHAEVARRAVYLHPVRWTSLGLSLLEAMAMGMPVVALATTEAVAAVPPGTGLLTTCPDEMAALARDLVADPERGAAMAEKARAHVLDRYGLARFLHDWDRLLVEVTS